MSISRLQKINNRVWQVISCKETAITEKYLVNSRVDAQWEVNNIIKRIDFKYHKNFIIFGIKNVKLLNEIYRRKTPFSTMTVIEILDESASDILLNASPQELAFVTDPTVTVVMGSGQDIILQLHKALSDLRKMYNLKNTEIISMPYVKSQYSREVQNLINIMFEKIYDTITGFGNDIEDILLGIENYLNGWSHVFRSLECSRIKNTCQGKTAIIVGAGPSLDKTISEIKKVKNKALILCVDAALDVLLDNDIVPDVVASIERTIVTAELYERDIIPQEIVYVGPNVVPEKIYQRFSRLIFTGRTGDAVFRDFNKALGFENLDAGSNVAHVLITFAEYLGCSRLIFTGMNLAYEEGKTHAARAYENFTDIEKEYYKSLVVKVKGQHGETLESYEYFMHAKSWIENYILNHNQIKFINCSPGGANIEGADNIGFEKILDELQNESIEAFHQIYDKLLEGNRIDIITTTNSAIDFFDNLNKYYNKIIKQCEQNYSNLSQLKNSNITKRIEEYRVGTEKVMSDNVSGAFIVQSLMIKYNRDIREFPMYLSKEDELRLKEISLNYYDTLIKVSKKITDNIKVYKTVLEHHLNNALNSKGEL